MIIYLVVIIGQSLPIKLAYHAPLVVKMVIAHMELLQPLLLVNTRKLLLPYFAWSRPRVEINPDEAHLVYMCVDRKQRIRRFVEI